MSWPFSLTLHNLVLEGKDKEKAKAKHQLAGEDLQRKLCEIEYDDKDGIEYKKAILELDYQYKKISTLDYSKRSAELKQEPWIGYRDYGLEDNNGHTGFWFDLDWNQPFVEKLKAEGYLGATDEDVVKKWYAELCRVVAMEEGLALDLFDEESEDPNSKSIKKQQLDENYSRYS